MSDNRLYLYDNNINIVLTTTSMYVDNRPMNNRNLKLHKGLTNQIHFTIRDRDRKKQNVYADTIRAHMINPSTKRRIFSRILDNQGDLGVVSLRVLENDIANINPGLYKLYIVRSDSETNDMPIYSDQDNNIQFDIEVTDQINVEPVATQSADTFLQTGNTVLGDAANSFVSSALYGNLDRNFSHAMHTMAISAAGYTGQVHVQGSCIHSVPDSDDASPDWFNITILDIADPQTTGNIVHTSFTVNCNWVRVLHYPVTGEITNIQLRN